jgi:hypothetical protein
MVLEYSRDAQAAPLKAIYEMFTVIRDKKFAPDAARSERFSANSAFLGDLYEEVHMFEELPEAGEGVGVVEGDVSSGVVQVSPYVSSTPGAPPDGASSEIELSSESEMEETDEECAEARAASAVEMVKVANSSAVPSVSAEECVSRHVKSGMLHIVRRAQPEVFVCGRPQSHAYKPHVEGDADGLAWPLCTRCFGGFR